MKLAIDPHVLAHRLRRLLDLHHRTSPAMLSDRPDQCAECGATWPCGTRSILTGEDRG
jgi:hypothetical protein